ncbi:hypothetical protein ACKVWC_010113 [Pyricularia oryzae]
MAAGGDPAGASDPTQSFTEKTEPFSQSEFDARMQSMRVQQDESFRSQDSSLVHLDELVVPPDKDIRTLVRPLRARSVSPGNLDNCEWLALHAEVASPEGVDKPQHRVMAVTQTSRDIKFSVRIPGSSPGLYGCQQGDEASAPTLWCELYYDPRSDNQILRNKSDIPISLTRVSQLPPASPGIEYLVLPEDVRALPPGTWRIGVEDVDVLDFRILEKRPATLRLPSLSSSGSSLSEMINSSGKRSLNEDEETPLGPEARRIRANPTSPKNQDGVIEFLPSKADKLVFPLPAASSRRELIPFDGHPLLDIEEGDTVDIPGGCELDTYQITKMDPIASTALSSVFRGVVDDHPDVPGDSVITVKVLKTRPPPSPNGQVRPQDNERTLIRQADIWQREFQAQEPLHHPKIPKLYGGDARFLSLYMEHVPAPDLQQKGKWRGLNNDFFVGTRDDARQILIDIGRALNYMHSRNRTHNDVKPANILYSRERGAVLIDMGLSTPTRSPGNAAGTPYYVPPEFLGQKLRGPAGDVWALGVTMLYALKKLPLPDSRGSVRPNQRPLHWQIADLNRPQGARQILPAQVGRGPPMQQQHQQPMNAVAKMQRWLGEVNEAKERLNTDDVVELLVAKMLVPNPAQRITMRKLIADLYAEQQQRQSEAGSK